MGLFSLALFAVLYVVSMLLEEKNRARDLQVSNQISARSSEFEMFKLSFGASDELVQEAITDELKGTKLAETIRKRLITEAGVDHKSMQDCFVSHCHLVALGILAQYGMIPTRLIDMGIKWSMDCVMIRPSLSYSYEAAQMMERFMWWYDKELTDHGVTEHLLQKKCTGRIDAITENGYLEQVTEIRNLPSLRRGEVLFWPSTRASLLTGCPIRKIARKSVS